MSLGHACDDSRAACLQSFVQNIPATEAFRPFVPNAAYGVMSGVSVKDECVEMYNRIKMQKDLKYVIFKIEDRKHIVNDCQGEKGQTFQDFVAKLPEDQPRYALCDIDYETADGRTQNKLCFFFWSPDDKTSVKDRMIYASSKDAIKKKLVGVMKEIQALSAPHRMTDVRGRTTNMTNRAVYTWWQ